MTLSDKIKRKIKNDKTKDKKIVRFMPSNRNLLANGVIPKSSSLSRANTLNTMKMKGEQKIGKKLSPRNLTDVSLNKGIESSKSSIDLNLNDVPSIIKQWMALNNTRSHSE